ASGVLSSWLNVARKRDFLRASPSAKRLARHSFFDSWASRRVRLSTRDSSSRLRPASCAARTVFLFHTANRRLPSTSPCANKKARIPEEAHSQLLSITCALRKLSCAAPITRCVLPAAIIPTPAPLCHAAPST